MNAISQRIAAVLLFVFAVAGVSSCSDEPKRSPQSQVFDINSIKSFRDIPGVTEDEIKAIEALKASRAEFVYGSVPSTEAFTLPDGTYVGFTTKLCGLLSELFGIPFVQELYVWKELKEGLDAKSIDFTGGLTPTPERLLEYSMTYPIAERGLGVFTRDDFGKIESVDGLQGLKIGFYAGTITAGSVFAAYPELNLKIVDVYNASDVKEKLSTGVIDAFITEVTEDLTYGDKLALHKNIFPLIYTPVSMTTANPDLKPIISVMDKYIAAGGIDRLTEFYKAGNRDYAKFEFYKLLTGEERAYLDGLIANNAKVPVALESYNYPISFYNDNEQAFQGIAPDVLAEIARLTDIEFENVAEPNEAWITILERLENGTAAMVSELLFTEERRGQFIWPETPYAVSRYALISKLDYPFLEAYQVVRTTVGMVSKSSREDVYRRLFPNIDNTKYYVFQHEALEALERGEIDLMMSSEYGFLILTNYLENPGYKINLTFNSPLVESFFGFNKKEEILCSIISKAIIGVDTGKIEKDWVRRTFNYEKKLAVERSYYANQRSVILAVSVFVLLLLLIIMSILFMRNIRNKNTIKDLAEQSNRSKSIFLAQMSHEIRTPLTAILGAVEIQLRKKAFSPDTEEAFNTIYNSGELLLQIIDDILDLSKIEAGKLELAPAKYDIPSLINDTAHLNRLRYESKPIDFKLRLDENTPLELIGDERRIRQILNNLLSNSFKYTQTGEVEMSIGAEPGRDNETVTLFLQVSDTGQGMNAGQIKRIFDEYARFNMETNHGISGTGLGMSITKRLIDMMNGEILIESEVGKGSVFTVRLPQKRCGSTVCGAELAESLRNFSFITPISKKEWSEYEYMPYGKVLVVDDVEFNLYVAEGLLAPYGLRIETAGSGVEAVDLIKNGNEYDVVFMDHMMPKMDGLKATKVLRDLGYSRPIIALTANALVGQAEMYLANGFDGFLSKPIDSHQLDVLLTAFIRDKKPPEIVEAARREQLEKET